MRVRPCIALAAVMSIIAALVPTSFGGGVVFKDDNGGKSQSSGPARPADAVNATFGEGRFLGALHHLGELDASHQDNSAYAENTNGVRHGKNLLDWIGLGTGPETDPFIAKANSLCLNGDFSECFKSRALVSLDDFFDRESYTLNENARVIRMPVTQLRSLAQEPFEFSSDPRADEPEWDQFVKFLARKVERFVKSAAIEVKLPTEVTSDGKYAPRFVDDIATEVDILEDKTDTKFSRIRLKKLLIPLLVILKLFKLKLLLFLPLILGLASFKKLLGFAAIVVPGLIGFFRICKPELGGGYGSFGHSNFYKPPPRYPHPPLYPHPQGSPYQYAQYAPGATPYTPLFRDNETPLHHPESPSSGSVAFRDPDAHDLAYQGYQNYQK